MKEDEITKWDYEDLPAELKPVENKKKPEHRSGVMDYVVTLMVLSLVVVGAYQYWKYSSGDEAGSQVSFGIGWDEVDEYVDYFLVYFYLKKPDLNVSVSEQEAVSAGWERLEFEELVFAYVNDERKKRGFPQLMADPDLKMVARRHSYSMAKDGYFDHVDFEGRGPTERAASIGYVCNKWVNGLPATAGVGENIHEQSLYKKKTITIKGEKKLEENTWYELGEISKKVVDDWMASPGHRKNILHGSYEKMGVGAYVVENYSVYTTLNFC